MAVAFKDVAGDEDDVRILGVDLFHKCLHESARCYIPQVEIGGKHDAELRER